VPRLGFIASGCLNRKVITLAEWETMKEYEKKEVEEESLEDEE